jgi:hypothetical protein
VAHVEECFMCNVLSSSPLPRDKKKERRTNSFLLM